MKGFMKLAVLLSCLLAVSLQGDAKDITCPAGTTLKPKVDYVADPNGCGGSDLQRQMDSIFNPFRKYMTTCCNDHDTCFGTCNTDGTAKQTFKECNDAFNSCLKRQCKKASAIEKVLCKAWANAYYIAVDKFGGTFYNEDQKASCTCQ
jgi:secretory phospholipase A2